MPRTCATGWRSMPDQTAIPLDLTCAGTFAERKTPSWPSVLPSRDHAAPWSDPSGGPVHGRARAALGRSCHRRAAGVETVGDLEESGDGPHSPSDGRLSSGAPSAGGSFERTAVSHVGEPFL